MIWYPVVFMEVTLWDLREQFLHVYMRVSWCLSSVIKSVVCSGSSICASAKIEAFASKDSASKLMPTLMPCIYSDVLHLMPCGMRCGTPCEVDEL